MTEIKVTRYAKRYIIHNRDSKGTPQMYILQEDGTWLDTFNETYVSQAFIDRHVTPYYQPAPSDKNLLDMLNSLEEE